MNVTRVCKMIPSNLPHELLGYHKDSLDGMLLTIDLLTKMLQEDAAQSEAENSGNSSAGAGARMAKFKNRK